MEFDHLPSRRVAAANSIGIAITRTSARDDTIARIVMTPDQLTVPNLEREEQGASMTSEHHIALMKLANYLPRALWEDTTKEAVGVLPRLYAAFGRTLDWFRFLLARLLDGMQAALAWLSARLHQHAGFNAARAEPDKLSLKSRNEKDRVADFLFHQKPRAMRGLVKRITQSNTSPIDRNHAIRTLSSITGRQFHTQDSEHAKTWVRKHTV
jgi:hypothetical protein